MTHLDAGEYDRRRAIPLEEETVKDEESAWIRPGWFVAVCGYGRCREAAGFRSREKRDRWAFDHGLAGHMVRFFCGVEEGEGEGSDVVPA